MNASELVTQYGAALVGRVVETKPFGQWPGGPATVIEIGPDKEAPEIVFQVRHLKFKDPETEKLWDIGVFEYEDVNLL